MVDPTVTPGNFFGTRDFLALASFNRSHKLSGLQQRIMGSGIKPGITLPINFTSSWLICGSPLETPSWKSV